MGTSVCAYHLRDCTQTECLKALALVKSPPAFVSAVTDKWLSVVDENSETFRLEQVEHTVVKLSKILDADIIATAVYDDAESLYMAFRAGIEIDRYSSGLGGFEWMGRRKFPGDPKRLSAAFEWWKGQDRLELALKKKYRIESQRLKEIVRAFGIPDYRALTKMNDLSNPLPFSAERVAELPPDSELGVRIRDRQAYVEFKWLS